MNKNNKSFKPTDAEIISGIRNNDSSVLRYLYKEHYPMILKLVINNSGTEEEAKDIYQESIIVLHHKIKDVEFELSSKLKTFIYSVSRRLWLKKLNSKSRYTEDISDYEEIIPVEEDLEQHEEKEKQFGLMQNALQDLGEPCKTIIEDFYLNNLNMQEICEKFGYTNSDNAKTQKYKCLQRLKKLFFNQK